MPESTKIAIVIIVVLLLLISLFSIDVIIRNQRAAEQTHRDYHVSIAIRAQQYMLRSYSVELDDSTRTAAFIESQQWLDSLKAGE